MLCISCEVSLLYEKNVNTGMSLTDWREEGTERNEQRTNLNDFRLAEVFNLARVLSH